MQWPDVDVDEADDVSYSEVGFRVRARVDGTSVKIDGIQLPGGFAVTAWV